MCLYPPRDENYQGFIYFVGFLFSRIPVPDSWIPHLTFVSLQCILQVQSLLRIVKSSILTFSLISSLGFNILNQVWMRYFPLLQYCALQIILICLTLKSRFGYYMINYRQSLVYFTSDSYANLVSIRKHTLKVEQSKSLSPKSYFPYHPDSSASWTLSLPLELWALCDVASCTWPVFRPFPASLLQICDI